MSNLVYREISMTEEVGSCLLCNNPPCTKACPYDLPVDTIIRSLRFENKMGAANRLSGEVSCKNCTTKACMNACLKKKINRPVPIDEIIEEAASYEKTNPKEVDLSINFCGIPCENPFFLSSSVVGSNYEMVAKAFEMGWAGVAFKTIGTFVPREVSPRFDALRKESVPFIGFKNIEQIQTIRW